MNTLPQVGDRVRASVDKRVGTVERIWQGDTYWVAGRKYPGHWYVRIRYLGREGLDGDFRVAAVANVEPA